MSPLVKFSSADKVYITLHDNIVTKRPLTFHCSIATSTTPEIIVPPSSSSAEATSSRDQFVKSLTPLPYHVYRTASQKLPIYHLAKRGGNLHQTRIRKIEGDRERLRDEIQRALGLKDELVIINRLTGHIIIKVRNDIY